MKASTPYLEALRYMENAKETLKMAGKDRYNYLDDKYVKTAAGTAYSGILVALDEYLKQKEGAKYAKPKSIEEYRSRVSKQDKKLLSLLNAAYHILHLLGYYYGDTTIKTMQLGFEDAFAIIAYIKD
jgi:flagellar biosynthesis chaperone FliJ